MSINTVDVSTLTMPVMEPLRRARPKPAPAVTVVVPTYNRVSLVGASLDSIARQTFRDFEVMVVDDGSSDNTKELIASRKEPIRYLWQHNQGPAAARNHALRLVRSEFVAFLDSDDLWLPTFLERTIGWLREHPEDALVFTDFRSIRASGKPMHGHRKRPYGGDVTARLFASTFICTPAVVVRSAVIRDAGGFDERMSHCEDYDLWLRLSLKHRFGLIEEPLFLRRCHHDSLSRKGCSPDVLVRKADMLARFYETGGGKAKIPADLAQKRIAKTYYSAAKAFLRLGRPARAVDLLRRSMVYRPLNLKTWSWYMRALLSRALAMEPPVEVPTLARTRQ